MTQADGSAHDRSENRLRSDVSHEFGVLGAVEKRDVTVPRLRRADIDVAKRSIDELRGTKFGRVASALYVLG